MDKAGKIGFVFRNRAPIGGAWECLIDGKPSEWNEAFSRTKADAIKWGEANTDLLIVDDGRRGAQWQPKRKPSRKQPAQYWRKSITP